MCSATQLKLLFIAWKLGRQEQGVTSSSLCADPSVIREVGIKQFSTFHDRPVIMLAPAAGKKLRAAQNGMLMATGAYWGSIRAAAQPLFHAARFAERYLSIKPVHQHMRAWPHARPQGCSVGLIAANACMKIIHGRSRALSLHAMLHDTHHARMIPVAWRPSCRA